MTSDAESPETAPTQAEGPGRQAGARPSNVLKSLDKDLKKIGRLEQVGHENVPRAAAYGICLVFLVLVWAYVQIQLG
ncbi:MAG: hypothetical protein ACTSUD_03785, partial [Alphaproteobacteria bacterium]